MKIEIFKWVVHAIKMCVRIFFSVSYVWDWDSIIGIENWTVSNEKRIELLASDR